MKSQFKHQYCNNCHHHLISEDKFCANCGQENKATKPRFRDLMKEFFAGVFNLDSKIFITPFALLKPGFLTKEFFKGRQKRYTHPGRLLLFSLVAYMALFSIFVKDEIDNLNKDSRFLRLEHTYAVLHDNRDTINNYLESKFQERYDTAMLDSIQRFMVGGDGEDDFMLLWGSRKFSTKDLMTLEDSEVFEKYKINTRFEKLFYSQAKRAVEYPGAYLRYVIGMSTWVILLSIPMLAFLLFLLYVRRKRYFVEHVVFLVHCNSFIFLLGVLGLLLLLFFMDFKILLFLPFLMGTLYTFPAMKVYYGQGYIKTFFKYGMMLFSLIVVYSILMGLAFVGGVFLF